MYSLLFIVACISNVSVQYYLGLKRAIPPINLALTLSTSLLLFMLFMKAPALYQEIPSEHILSIRYMMTGLLGGVLAILISRYLLKVSFHRIDDAALLFPLVLFFVKTGCYFAGCCFGIATHSDFGVAYPENSPAHVFHATQSLAMPLLHPVQLYEALGSLSIFIIVLLMRSRLKSGGSTLFFSLVLYLPLRFVCEFFRASDAFVLIGPFKVVHIIIGAFFLLMLTLLIRNEKKAFFSNIITKEKPKVQWVYFLVLISGFLAGSRYLHFIEQIGIILILTFTLFLLLSRSLKKSDQNARWAISGSLGIIILIFTAQIPASTDTVQYNTVSVGFGTGSYLNNYVVDGDGCSSISRDFEQKYAMYGAGFASTKRFGERYSTQLGVNVFGGNQTETWLDSLSMSKSYNVMGVSAYAQGDLKWIGGGIGLSVGHNLRFADDRDVDSEADLNKGSITLPVMPSFYVRVGPKRILYGELRFANAFPSPSPAQRVQAGIGTGFGLTNGFSLNTGIMGHEGAYMGLSVPIKKVTLDAQWFTGTSHYYTNNTIENYYKQQQIAFSLRYHYNKK